MSSHRTDRIFTDAATCFVKPFILQIKESDECFLKHVVSMLLPLLLYVYFIYVCPCSVVVECLPVYPFFFLIIFLDHVNKFMVFVFRAIVYIYIFVTTFLLLQLVLYFLLMFGFDAIHSGE